MVREWLLRFYCLEDWKKAYEARLKAYELLEDRLGMTEAERDEARSHRDYCVEIKHNCDKIIADLMNQRAARERERDEARKVARRILGEAPWSVIEEYQEAYPWLKEEG